MAWETFFVRIACNQMTDKDDPKAKAFNERQISERPTCVISKSSTHKGQIVDLLSWQLGPESHRGDCRKAFNKRSNLRVVAMSTTEPREYKKYPEELLGSYRRPPYVCIQDF